MANDDPVDDENPRSNTTNNSINDKLAEVFDMVSVHKHQYKMPTFAFHTNKTITEALHRPLLRAQASMVTTS
ncbi:hypothetical protein ZEAMMB73_Zm00001d010936 [Zea mays]|uniref:Uncharacterized protein n=1 Tax=Zea mays TaxID=4577 RepID=B6SYJ4_MAIZE|nr:hypothetical protein [Zea mays]ACG40248.1 hypothetical protein [Zea mays]AQK95276.1 hypothetical protein ZEAMMB73_Zm00001d010936 [Zea mays]AQK95278.1 hypothetical protein ZEAMMB73_Zm00001d010936 [Zea mays]